VLAQIRALLVDQPIGLVRGIIVGTFVLTHWLLDSMRLNPAERN
jgi:uncharacterized protein YneF (UPF0154 family)